MGMNGSVIIFPVLPKSSSGFWSRLTGGRRPAIELPTTPEQLESSARALLHALEELSLLQPGTAQSAVADEEPTFATSELLEDEPPEDIQWVHLSVDPSSLHPNLGQLVYTATEKEWFSGSRVEDPEAIAVPGLDVTCFSKPVSLRGAESRAVATSWLFLEFDFGDARLSPEVHTIREPAHPIFNRLSSILGSPVKWAVIAG